MQRTISRGLAATLAFFAASLATAQAPTVSAAATVRPAPPSLMSQFDVAAATVQTLVVPAGSPDSVDVTVVMGGQPLTFRLVKHDVRAPNYQLFESGSDGLVPLPRPECVTYRGYIEQDPGSEVAATVEGGSVEIFARLGSGDVWAVQPVREVQPTAGPALHIIYRAGDSVAPPRQCGVKVNKLPVPAGIGEDMLYLCELACEADYPFFQRNGSNTTNTQNDITGIVNAMNVIYERDVDVRFVITQIVVNSSPDPYTTTSAGTLLNQFGSRWNTVYGGIQRDVAHLFTGRNIQGGTIGIATVGTVCNVGSAYGLSESRYTGNFTLRVSLTAHECGHNFGAGHCNSSPPCHIMCSGNGGCSTPTLFGTSARNQIISYRQSVSCLQQQQTAPVISSVSQVTIPTVQPPQVTVTGSGFLGAQYVTVGSTQVTGLQVVNDTTLRFFPPWGEPLGFVQFTVTTGVGTSNGATLWYQDSNPADLIVPSAVIGGNNMEWRMGGVQNDFCFLVLSLQSTTSPWMGWQLVDAPIIFWTGGLDARGIAVETFPVPANTLSGLRVYSQLIDIIDGTLNVRSLSGVESTIIVL
ncbi:MAG: M12 family metallo-peptidase [bacterium]|nr:M12 family metallo-peptidase [bacterium]